MSNELEGEPSRSWQEYLAIVVRRRWWLLLPLLGGWGISLGVSSYLPTLYRSETVILVEQQKVPEHYVVPNVAVDLQERLQSMTQQILSRTRLQQIIEDFHLYAGERARFGPDDLIERMRKDIRIELVQAPGRPTELTAFKIYFSGPDPRLTQQVTSQLTSFFIEENLRARQQQSEETTNFLDNQLKEARQHLELQESELRKFRARYLGQLPGQLQGNIQILSGLQGRLQDASERLNRAEQQKLYFSSLASQYRGIVSNLEQGTAKPSDLATALGQELDHLKTQAADLRARYTEKHPDVLHLNEQIAKVEKLRQQIETEPSVTSGQTGNPKKQSLRPSDMQAMSPLWEIESQLKATDLEIGNRKREISDLEKQVEEYQSRLNGTPLREQQLADINRDYDQSRANYESLLAKRNQSELATNLERRQQGEQFRIIDPPNLPARPYSPNRFQFSLMGLAVGFVLGLAITATVETIDDRLYAESQLEDIVGGAVLCQIPPLPTSLELRRRRVWAWVEAVCSGLLVALMAGATFVAYYRG